MSDTYLLQCANCGTECRVTHDQTGQRLACPACKAPMVASQCLPQQVGDDAWEAEILAASTPAIVVFSGEKCAVCADYEASVRLLAARLFGRVRVLQVSVDDSPATAARYDVAGVPTVLLFDGGTLLHTLPGPQGERGLLEKLGLR